MESKAELTYALNREGKLVHVDSVPNGKSCSCFCPHCKSELCAKNCGDSGKRIHHFAHLNGADCGGGKETALHLMAKEILRDSKCLRLPYGHNDALGEVIHFSKVDVEFHDIKTGLRPDCVGYYGNKLLWVEFKRTHAVDAKKRGKIISAKIDCIEIDLSHCELDPDKVKEFITNSSDNRIWIRNTERMGIELNPKGAYGNYYDCSMLDDDNQMSCYRRYAKDENGVVVNLQSEGIDMNSHSYYCLACGKELTIGVRKNGAYYFEHLEKKVDCDDMPYLREAAKEVLLEKFINKKKFMICLPQYSNCSEKQRCALYSREECSLLKDQYFDLKEYGYSECLKDCIVPGTNEKCDLIIKFRETFDKAIVINVLPNDRNHIPYIGNLRTIVINTLTDHNIQNLMGKPINSTIASFCGFKEDEKHLSSYSEVNRRLYKFYLYSSGKFFWEIIPCSKISYRPPNTVCELFFLGKVSNRDWTELLALWICFKARKKACYCRLCCNSVFSNRGIVCKRYKTKGTPQYPVKAPVVNCAFFQLDIKLVNHLDKEFKDVKYLER